MLQSFARAAAALALVLTLNGPALAQGVPELRRPSAEHDSNGWVMGLAALAVLGLAVREAQDEEEDERLRVPARCLVDWPTPDGATALYDADCLDLEYRAAAHLPLDCAVTVRSRGRFVSGFSPDCLREEGWRLERN